MGLAAKIAARIKLDNNAPKYKHVIYSKGKADIYVNEELDEETRKEYFKVMESRAKSLKRSMRGVE